MTDNIRERIRSRHSVRSYSIKSIGHEIRQRLLSETTMTNSHEAGLNFRLVFDNEDPFRGFARSYGMFRNARNYLACIVDPTFPDAEERAGYFAERFVMEAVGCGLGTCFIGGTFSERHVDVDRHVYEKIPFIVAFGYPEDDKTSVVAKIAKKMSHRHIRLARNFFDGDDSLYNDALCLYPWLAEALEALSLAPSSLNRQPVRISLSDNGQLISRTEGRYTGSAVDLGIGKFNFAAVAPGEWEWGENAPFLPY